MNILILTARFGMGHVKTAEAIKEELLLKDENVNVEIVDLISYLFPKSSEYIYKSFNFMVSRCSGLYNMLNKFAGKKGGAPLKVTITKKIDKLLEIQKADAIVVVFPVCSQYISAYKKIRRCNIPMYTYITDITAHEEWIADGTDQYFVGDETTKNTLISKGVADSQILVSGIPVRQTFKVDIDKKVSERKNILVMGGGLGLLPDCDKVLDSLSKSNNLDITIIAGSNKALQEKMQKAYPSINVIGFTNRVDDYMRKADLVISKAGGITTFEAIYTRTPLYVIKPFLEQEYGNAKFIEEHNIGRVIWSKDIDIEDDLKKLLNNDVLLQTMMNNMKNIRDKYEAVEMMSAMGYREGEKCS